MSFFHFINTLSELEWPFTLIFRTFGSDLPFILKEWKEFVTGVHDCKPRGKILEQIKANYVEPLTGCIYRDKESLYLCLGVCVSAIAAKIEEGDTEEVILAKLRALPGCTEVRQISFHSLSRELLQYYQASNNVGGLVDYYPCWAQAAEGRCGGKVFPVQLTGADHYTVFYDDNIFIGDEKSIVDLRDAESSASLLGGGGGTTFLCASECV
ncbi:hypothetical protein AGDE_11097 [Angomonas deanei]|nr:hypothetical protein AGDE_11097 [Angomonas deanei]|eukprot:EPY26776.1 hypothetical protein AGDE_11097 [Angomonas deanei]